MAGYMVGIDVGGTFTDFVSYDPQTKAVEVWKNPSTPKDPNDGILTGLGTFKNPGDIKNIRLGTTVATNAILERKGATVGYVTTAGFRDIPFIQRGNRRSHYDITWIKPKPLVKRRHCYEISERVMANGEVEIPLDEAGVRAMAKQIKDEGEIEALLPGEVVVRSRVAGLEASTTVRVNPTEVGVETPVVYLTQSTQRQDGTVPLVADRSALLRVFLKADRLNFFLPLRAARQNNEIVSTAC